MALIDFAVFYGKTVVEAATVDRKDASFRQPDTVSAALVGGLKPLRFITELQIIWVVGLCSIAFQSFCNKIVYRSGEGIPPVVARFQSKR